MKDPFEKIASDAHFNIYNSPMWKNTGRRFAEALVERHS